MMKKNIVIIGLPGCGKTTLGAHLAEQIAYQFVDLDEEIETRSGKKISQLFEIGEAHFRDVESQVTKAVAASEQSVISTGGGIVLREENIAALKEHGLILFLNRSLKDITGDIDIEERPLLREGVERLQKIHDDRIHLYHQYADVTVDNVGEIEDVIQTIITELQERSIL